MLAGSSGMELKLRQYELGKAFCDAIVEESGIDGLQPSLVARRGAADSRRARAALARGSSGWAGDRPRPRPEPVETLAPTV